MPDVLMLRMQTSRLKSCVRVHGAGGQSSEFPIYPTPRERGIRLIHYISWFTVGHSHRNEVCCHRDVDKWRAACPILARASE